MDRWEGTFPSEDAAKAWAAIDALARQYVTDGVCSGIERARAKALTDLVAGNATIDTIITITVPATAVPATAAPTPPPGSDGRRPLGRRARRQVVADADAGAEPMSRDAGARAEPAPASAP